MQTFTPNIRRQLRSAAIIVESEKKLLVPYSTALTQAGFSAEMVSITKKGFQQLIVNPPQLLILDIDRPAQLGEKMLGAILRRQAIKNTTIFLLTDNLHLSSQYTEKVDLVLSKPILLSNLISLAARHTLIKTRLRDRLENEVFDYQTIPSNYLLAH